MDKRQAEQYYKESCEASKERVKSGGQHYKRVNPNYEVLAKQGLAKKVDSGQATKNRENLKRFNADLTRGGKIGRGPRKK